jgi:hypothetical protein
MKTCIRCHARCMGRERYLRFFALPVLICCMTAVAQDKGDWRAVSTTARSITGDVVISGEKISINLTSFAIAAIRALKPEEESAVFGLDSGAGGSGNLYRLNIPATKKFLHKNSMCGAEDTQWMATYVSGRNLQIAFFSGQQPPQLTAEALTNSTDLCGTYSYAR